MPKEFSVLLFELATRCKTIVEQKFPKNQHADMYNARGSLNNWQANCNIERAVPGEKEVVELKDGVLTIKLSIENEYESGGKKFSLNAQGAQQLIGATRSLMINLNTAEQVVNTANNKGITESVLGSALQNQSAAQATSSSTSLSSNALGSTLQNQGTAQATSSSSHDSSVDPVSAAQKQMRSGYAQLYLLDQHRMGPSNWGVLGIDGINNDSYKRKNIESLSPDVKVLLVFTHTARMSSNVAAEQVIPFIEKFGENNIALLGLAPNDVADGVPTYYDITKDKNIRCFQLPWTTSTREFKIDSPTYKNGLDDLKEFIGEKLDKKVEETSKSKQAEESRGYFSGWFGR
jgi:hypothetical protein